MTFLKTHAMILYFWQHKEQWERRWKSLKRGDVRTASCAWSYAALYKNKNKKWKWNDEYHKRIDLAKLDCELAGATEGSNFKLRWHRYNINSITHNLLRRYPRCRRHRCRPVYWERLWVIWQGRGMNTWHDRKKDPTMIGRSRYSRIGVGLPMIPSSRLP